MMANINKTIHIGRVVEDPEIRENTKGTPVANFRIATEEYWVDPDGCKQRRTEKHRCVAWGKLAEVCERFMQKGSQVFIQGKLENHEWEDGKGIQRVSTEIVVKELTILENRKEN